jgi:hypothetical protein
MFWIFKGLINLSEWRETDFENFFPEFRKCKNVHFAGFRNKVEQKKPGSLRGLTG